MTDAPAQQDRTTRLFFAALAVLVAMRVAGIFLTPLNLGPDEAQYWRWGQTFEWGYFSKPPLIAWVIGGTTALFGDSEAAARLAAPLLHAIAASILFILGRNMYGPQAGLLAGLGYALMPGVILSSAVISTDGVLLPIWSAALFCLWRMRQDEAGWITALGLGAAVGAGFLAKYAMLYFGIGIALTILFDQSTRRALLSWKGLAALGVAIAVFAPHLVWNAANDFKTVGHTVDNANLGGPLLNPENAGKFLTDQMGVFGPVSFLVLLGGAFAMQGSDDTSILGRDRWLLCFIVPVLVIIMGQAVLSRAHANWAATAYPAASILIAGWMTRAGPAPRLWFGIAAFTFIAVQFIPDMPLLGRLGIGGVFALAILAFARGFKNRPVGLLWASMAIHAAVAVAFTFIAIGPVSWSEGAGVANAFKRTRGWEETTAALAARAEAENATAILVDERENWHGLDYYGRDGFPVPVIAWRRHEGAKSYSEEDELIPPLDERVLVASVRKDFRPRMRADFDTFTSAGTIEIPLGGGKTRRMKLYLASGFDPLARTPEWDARFEGLSED